ncbi:MAG: hypothetical protein ACM3WV_08840 [Bacillota bacterium]
MRNRNPGELIFFSALAGTAAAPAKMLVHHIFEWAGLAVPFYTRVTVFLIHGHFHPMELAGSVFGELGDMTIGALFGVLLGWWLQWSRPKYHWWIGAVFGVAVWFFTLSFGNLTGIIKAEQTEPWSLFAHFLAMISFGLFVVLLTRIWKPLKERLHGASRVEEKD